MKKYYQSAVLQMIEKGIRLPVSLVMSVLVANYLGAEQFGTLTVAYTIVMIGAPLATFGIDGIVYQRIQKTSSVSTLLSTAIAIQLFGFLMLYLALVVFVLVFSGQEASRDLVLTVGVIIGFSAFNPLSIFLVVNGLGVPKVLIHLLSFGCVSIFRASLLILEADLYFFALAYIVETSSLAILLLSWARLKGVDLGLRYVDRRVGKGLLRSAFPLLLSLIMINVFMRIDILMIDRIMGSASVGQYAVAVQLVGVVAIFPAILGSALFPIAMREKAVSKIRYFSSMRNILLAGYIIGLGAVLFFFTFGEYLIGTIYTDDYKDSAYLIQVLCFASIFQFYGSFSTLWLVNEGLQRYRVYRVASAMCLNVILNILWIPVHGTLGAAYATLLSYFVASILGNAFTSNTRPIFWLQLNVLLTFGFLGRYRR